MQGPPLKFARPPRAAVLFLLIMGVALLVRLPGTSFGMPYLWHPDEPQLVNRAIRILQTGVLDPGFFAYPNLNIYLHAVWEALGYLRLAGREEVPPVESIATQFSSGVYHVVGMPALWEHARKLTALQGALAAGLTFLAGRRLFGNTVGFVAGVLLALTPHHVQQSTFATVDVPASTALAALLAASALVITRGRHRDYLLAALALGWVVSCKYNAVTAFVLPLLAWYFGPAERRTVGAVWIAATLPIAALVLAATSPYSLIHPWQFLGDVGFEVHHYRILGQRAGTPYSVEPGLEHASRIVSFVVLEGMPIWSLLAVVGARLAWRRLPAAAVLLVAYPVAFTLFMSGMRSFYHRNLVSIEPALCVLAALAMVEGAAFVRRRAPRAHTPILAVAGAILLAPAVMGVEAVWAQAQEVDSRVAVASWAKDNTRGMVLGVPEELNLNLGTFEGVEVAVISLRGQTPGEWKARGITHVVGSPRVRVLAEKGGLTQASVDAAKAWFAARPPVFEAGKSDFQLDNFSIQPTVGVYSLGDVEVSEPSAVDDEPALLAKQAGDGCSIRPADEDLDTSEVWAVLPPSMEDQRAFFGAGRTLLKGSPDGKLVLVCSRHGLPVSSRMRVKGRWSLSGVQGGTGARVNVRFFDLAGKPLVSTAGTRTNIQTVAAGRADLDWTTLDKWVGVPPGAAEAKLCMELHATDGSAWLDNVRVVAME
jgi:4-amino-4-deoxy-L-arabinose transferase-like glycosyltransferase